MRKENDNRTMKVYLKFKGEQGLITTAHFSKLYKRGN